MATLQAIAPLLALEPPALSLGRTPLEEEGLIVAARLPAAIGLIHAAIEDHLERPYPSSRRYGERFLQLLHGGIPTPDQVAAFERTQILQLDHSFNAGTFAARVVSSTLAPPSAALSAAIGALSARCTAGRISTPWKWRWKWVARTMRARSSRPASPPAGS